MRVDIMYKNPICISIVQVFRSCWATIYTSNLGFMKNVYIVSSQFWRETSSRIILQLFSEWRVSISTSTFFLSLTPF